MCFADCLAITRTFLSAESLNLSARRCVVLAVCREGLSGLPPAFPYRLARYGRVCVAAALPLARCGELGSAVSATIS